MEEIIKRLHELIESGLPKGTIKRYYVGAPDTRTDRVMPSIETEVTSIDYVLGPTGMDEVMYSIDMYVVFSKKQGVKDAGGRDVESTKVIMEARAGYNEMMSLIHGVDDTGTYVAYKDSIMKILRSHIVFSGETLNTENEIAINNNIHLDVLPSDNEQSFFAVRISMKISQLIHIIRQ